MFAYTAEISEPRAAKSLPAVRCIWGNQFA